MGIRTPSFPSRNNSLYAFINSICQVSSVLHGGLQLVLISVAPRNRGSLLVPTSETDSTFQNFPHCLQLFSVFPDTPRHLSKLAAQRRKQRDVTEQQAISTSNINSLRLSLNKCRLYQIQKFYKQTIKHFSRHSVDDKQTMLKFACFV